MSFVDPDGFASNFGLHPVKDNFAEGLAWLLHDVRWRARGALARQYVTNVFAVDHAMDLHIDAYQSLLGDNARTTDKTSRLLDHQLLSNSQSLLEIMAVRGMIRPAADWP